MLKRKGFFLIAIILMGFWFMLGMDNKEYISSKYNLSSNYNIIYISLTNLRADHLSTYGYGRETSPNIDKLSEKSLVFENFFSHASWTLPVAISLFSSKYPFEHKIFERYKNTLNKKEKTLTNILKNKGYYTAAFGGSVDYSPTYGVLNRFDYFNGSKINAPNLKRWEKYGLLNDSAGKAILWLDENHNKKFFLWVQAYDLHCPFAMPEENKMFDQDYKGNLNFSVCYWTFNRTKPIKINKSGNLKEYFQVQTTPIIDASFYRLFDKSDIKHMIALYDGEIYNADKWIGKILEKVKDLGIEEKTIIIISSEHGDMFGKDGRFMRGGPLRGTFYDDVLHVPLIIYHPQIKAKRINSLAQVIDVAPTILDLLGLQEIESFKGKSLIPAIFEDKEVNEYVFAGSKFNPPTPNSRFQYNSTLMSIRDHDWKLIIEKIIYNSSKPSIFYSLYNIKEDPEESKNLFEEESEIFKKYKKELEEWQESFS